VRKRFEMMMDYGSLWPTLQVELLCIDVCIWKFDVAVYQAADLNNLEIVPQFFLSKGT